MELTEEEMKDLLSVMDEVEEELKNNNEEQRNNINLLVWFQLNYPELVKDMKQCSHHYSEMNLNPFHLEGDIWTHTMLVYNQAVKDNFSIEVKIAALLHDIGKVEARFLKDGYKVAFFNHENISTVKSIEILNKLEKEINFNYERVLYLINHHSFFHNIGKIENNNFIIKESEKSKINKMFGNNIEFYIDMINLSKCDTFGRFTLEEENFQPKIEYLENFIPYSNYKINKKNFPTAIMLSGLPASGKSTFVKEFLRKNPDYVYLSSDELIMKKFPNYTYNQAFEKIMEKDDFKWIEKELREKLNDAIKKRKNIIFDRTNLTKKTRNRWFNLVPFKYYKKINLFFIADLKTIMDRNSNREGKNLSKEIYNNMIKNYNLPTYQEEFDEIKLVNTLKFKNYSSLIKEITLKDRKIEVVDNIIN